MAAFTGVIVAALVIAASGSNEGKPPIFPDVYHVQAVLYVPYAEIREPIEAWYDSPNNRSRVDFYDTMKTYQRPDLEEYGILYKVAPMTTDEKLNALTCFQVNGTSNVTVSLQGLLPNTTDFKLVGTENYGGTDCEKWEKIDASYQKISKYTLWVTKTDPPEPIHYQMKGYNSLLGSHFDKYDIDYLNYTANVNFSDEIFDPPKNLICRSFPGPGADDIALHSPLKAFIDNEENHVQEAFEDFKTQHDKFYESEHEHEMRKNIFRQNHRYIHSMNRAGLSYTLAVNHLADWTDGERRVLRGKLRTKGYNGGLAFNTSAYSVSYVPPTLDWRLYGAVTPVKDQSICGSCWSFGTTGAIESAWFLKTGQLVRLSQQALIDCTWGYQNNGCDGGEDFRSYQWIMKHGGIPTEESYGPYLGADSTCHADNATKVAAIASYVNVTAGDIDAMKLAMVNHGPLSVAIDASHKSFSFYYNGVYYNPKCRNDVDGLDHAVLAVGYGVMSGEPYWLVKNSWSTNWGNDGYVLFSQRDNNCGVATTPTFVNLV